MTATRDWSTIADSIGASGTRSRYPQIAGGTGKVDLRGEWRVDETKPQFGGTVKFPKGELLLEADFPPFLSGEGRMPSPLIYCFYGALSCYTTS